MLKLLWTLPLMVLAGVAVSAQQLDLSDGKIPLQIKWRNDSYVRIPIWK